MNPMDSFIIDQVTQKGTGPVKFEYDPTPPVKNPQVEAEITKTLASHARGIVLQTRYIYRVPHGAHREGEGRFLCDVPGPEIWWTDFFSTRWAEATEMVDYSGDKISRLSYALEIGRLPTNWWMCEFEVSLYGPRWPMFKCYRTHYGEAYEPEFAGPGEVSFLVRIPDYKGDREDYRIACAALRTKALEYASLRQFLGKKVILHEYGCRPSPYGDLPWPRVVWDRTVVLRDKAAETD